MAQPHTLEDEPVDTFHTQRLYNNADEKSPLSGDRLVAKKGCISVIQLHSSSLWTRKGYTPAKFYRRHFLVDLTVLDWTVEDQEEDAMQIVYFLNLTKCLL